jgi:hypothetical protein
MKRSSCPSVRALSKPLLLQRPTADSTPVNGSLDASLPASVSTSITQSSQRSRELNESAANHADTSTVLTDAPTVALKQSSQLKPFVLPTAAAKTSTAPLSLSAPVTASYYTVMHTQQSNKKHKVRNLEPCRRLS